LRFPFLNKGLIVALTMASTALTPAAAWSETISGALTKAYQLNSQLNSARAGVRVTDEDVPIAKSGQRPVIFGNAAIEHSTSSLQGARITAGSFGVTLSQNLFDGFQTRNNVRAAESRVRAARYSLSNTEQNILFDAAAAYMDVIRDRQVAALTERNLAFLEEQVRAAESRLEVGEGTRTDVAQAQASRASAIAQLNAARAQVQTSSAIYRQLIGEDPGQLAAAAPVPGLPNNLEHAYAVAEAEHPAILATRQLVDASDYAVKSAEGALLPSVTGLAGVSQVYTHRGGVADGGSESSTNTNIGLTLSVPIYQGGLASAQVRQSKESLGRARIEVDVSRDQVRAALASAWSLYRAAVQSVAANREVISAAQLALSGVIEERNVGQRTTLDVLNAQGDVITAQINLASSERDVVVASYAIMSALGRLSAERLRLNVEKYEPREHYEAVKDKWYGLRTPDGR
jgi:outer membrane protein